MISERFRVLQRIRINFDSLMSFVCCRMLFAIKSLTNLSWVFLAMRILNCKRTESLFFDFYHQAGIFTHNLNARVKKVVDKDIVITRFSEAEFDLMENSINVSYVYLICDGNQEPLFLENNDIMRFFSTKELEYYLKNVGFRTIEFFDLDDFHKMQLTSQRQNGYCVAKK